MIALRARRTAHQVASAVQHPPLPGNPEHVVPLEPIEKPRYWGETDVVTEVSPRDEVLASMPQLGPLRNPDALAGKVIIIWITLWLVGMIVAAALLR